MQIALRFVIGLIVAIVLSVGCVAKAEAGDVRLEAGRTQIYAAPDACAVTRYAANELSHFLSESLGCVVPVTNVFLDGRVAVVVGDCAAAREADVDVSKLPRDGGIIRAVGGRVYVAGIDDPKIDERGLAYALTSGIRPNMYERGSEFAVYEFLERYVGVRFYFPGELGTVVPKRAGISVPTGVITNRPDYTYRDYAAWEMGAWFDKAHEKDGRQIMHHRHRLHTEYIPCSHGLNEFHYLKRFGKTHPEYFQLKADGTRNVDPNYSSPGQLCHSSRIWEEVYQDVKSYFLGESAEVRGVPAWPTNRCACGWNVNTKEIKGLGKFADVMPQDAFQRCCCTNCQTSYRMEKGSSFASDLIWGNVVRLCNRLKAEGVEGTVTMMGYTPYANPPDIELPDNLLVMVARGGPWREADPMGCAREKAEIKWWSEKLGKKVWLWNYPCKFRGESPDIPEHCPRAWAKYYKDLSPYIFGAFVQNTTTRWMYGHLNTYVYGKVCWNNSTDVDALLEEYYALMYGNGREEMKEFFETFERKWIGGVCGKIIDTPLGPTTVQPSDYTLFTHIFSSNEIARLDSLLKRAARSVGRETIEARRIALMRREYLLPLRERAEKYIAGIDVKVGLAKRAQRSERNILINGDFKDGLKGWQGTAELGPDSGIGCSAVIKMTATDGKDCCVRQMLNAGAQRLKPNTRYRMSFFVKYENVVPTKKKGGVFCNLWTEGQNWFPQSSGHTGTADWIYQETEIVSRPEKGLHGGYDSCSFSLCIRDATGTAWFADARVEEVGK